MRTIRFHHRAPCAALCLLLAGTAAYGVPTVKISLSAEDPNVHAREHSDTEPITFYVFVDGMSLRAAEFGLEIQGGEFVEFLIDTKKPWIPLPIPDPYPGTIAQAGIDCYEPPVYFGRLIVQPTQAGEKIVVDAIPSERDEQALFQMCDFDATNGFVAYPAAVNSKPPPPHEVEAPKPLAGFKQVPRAAGPEPAPQPAETAPQAEPPPVAEEEPE